MGVFENNLRLNLHFEYEYEYEYENLFDTSEYITDILSRTDNMSIKKIKDGFLYNTNAHTHTTYKHTCA